MQWLAIAVLLVGASSAIDVNSLTPLSSDDELSRVGRCPTKTIEPSQCPARDRRVDPDECSSDDECAGDSKCCSDGCRRLCIMPLLTSCERQRVETIKRARALHADSNEIGLPNCDKLGDYEPVQCDPASGNCFCVDESGFEVAGTRARSLESVNCTNPKPCAGLLCRMLCPFEFELDDEGCPRCECRDPCRGVKCPGSQTCQLETVPCAKEPCRPVPTCKQSRSIESLCPAGTPLTMPGGDRPFLCGNQVGQPRCPELFDCIVAPGNDYGVCCTAAERLTKPGSCPASGNATVCGVPCENDMQCHGSDKCCASGEQCNGPMHCVPPHNFSLCVQQKRIAELLTIAERKDRGYIPQCDPTNGDRFFKRQCSRNGLVCWCVDPDSGATVRGTMGSADEVVCEGLSNSVGRSLRCEATVCGINCDYGFRADADGCPSCECANPCDQLACPGGKECVMRPDESCPHGAKPANCLFRPECRNVFVPPCAHGEHLTNQASDEAIQCTVGAKFACPTGYRCTFSLPNNSSYCCPEAGPVAKHDAADVDARLPTICEIMRDVSLGKRQAEQGYRLALKSPKCNDKGEFEEVQCEGDECWCVDEFGVELADTRGARDQCSEPFCAKMRQDVESECPGLLCRLGCDYGFSSDNETGCPVCECRNPCDALKCPDGETCQMVVQQCDEAPFCPALPYCVALERSIEPAPSCPAGEPLAASDGAPVACSTNGRSTGCPSGHACHSEDGASGICCPIQRTVKAGQCPYLVPVAVDSCDSECTSDEDCDGQSKCCSNGCGTQCVEPILKTACQHAQMIAKYSARSANKPAHRRFIPRCRPDDGAFEPVQCDPATRACWCVTGDGLEVAGTRVPPGLQPQCHSPRRCPVLNECPADVADCPHGREIDTSGCPTCACRDPCDKVHCRPGVEECRLVQLSCVGEPCPPQPLCLPLLDNPCSYGQPLKDSANKTFECGPMGSTCPSTHKCHLSPLGEFSVCCPKPRDVCFQETAVGSCKASQLRWSFNEKRNRCEAFRFTGCAGNANNFDSERDCRAVCPSLSSCEELREKNLKLAEKYKKVVFTPKCNRANGDWEPVQCLEEVGVCWCVDKDGEHIKGTLTRGVPVCGVRQARQRAIDPPICDDPRAVVHACNRTICEGKICLANPRAVCRVDPCGGCRHAFYEPANGRKVDCRAGLTPCQEHVQSVLNSDAWARQGGPWGFQPAGSLLNYQYSIDSYAGRGETDAELLSDDSLGSVTVLRLKRQAADGEPESATETATVSDTLVDDDVAQVGPSELLAALVQETATELANEEDVTEESAAEETRQAKKLALPIDGGLFDGDVTGIQALDDERPSSQRPVPALRDAIKPGFCPPVHSRTYLRVLAQFAGGSVCADQCLSDADCDGPARCCPGECGSACTNPIVLPTPLLPKPGFCPAVEFADGCPAGLEAANECSMDADCSARAKCCFNGCYSTCSQPQEDRSGPLVMTLSPPVCTPRGDYAREQSHGELSWCVDSNGQPIDDSFTRGSVRCSPNGTVLEQRALGPVCRDPNAQPTVCRDECMRARCPFHPDAICVADPCNRCAVSFVDAAGHPVQCTDRCTMPAETGFCRALLPRYFYNATSETCEEFVFGGCDGNENNFETIDECRNECEKPDHVCELPKETGLCRASIARWYYDAEAQRCEKFVFGGCGGNANNFHSYEQCANRCPDLVVCPHRSPSGEMKTCSRHEACRGKTCRGHPDAKCSVDPCTCSPVFVDADDRPLDCLPVEEPELMTESRHAKLDVPAKEEATTTTSTTTTSTTTTTTTVASSSVSPSPRGKAIEHAHYTRCQKMRQAQLKKEAAGDGLVFECDHLGRFQPIQCLAGKAGEPGPRCWCVDEAGNQVPNTTHFKRGERTCRLVPVMAVAVTLGFPVMDHTPDELEREVRDQMADLLNGLSARTVEETLEIVTRDDGTILSFTLVGENKIDVASHLEDMVKSGHLTLDMHGHTMPADVCTSKFQHKLDVIPRSAQTDGSFTERILETKEILSQALDIEAPYLAVIVVLSVIASILVCGLIVGLVLHHRRTTGTYPKGAQTLASSPKQRKSAADRSDVVPRGFPRVGISPSDVVHAPQLSPTVPRSKRQNRNADAW